MDTNQKSRRELLASVSWVVLAVPPRSAELRKQVGYGKCADCACPSYVGSFTACSRSGCGHHYDRHW